MLNFHFKDGGIIVLLVFGASVGTILFAYQ